VEKKKEEKPDKTHKKVTFSASLGEDKEVEIVHEENPSTTSSSIGSGKLHEERVRLEEERKRKEFEDLQIKKNLEIQQQLNQNQFNEKKNLIEKAEEDKTKTGVRARISSFSGNSPNPSPIPVPNPSPNAASGLTPAISAKKKRGRRK